MQAKLQGLLLAHEKPLPEVPDTGAAYWGDLPHPLNFNLAEQTGGRSTPSMEELVALSKKVNFK